MLPNEGHKETAAREIQDRHYRNLLYRTYLWFWYGYLPPFNADHGPGIGVTAGAGAADPVVIPGELWHLSIDLGFFSGYVRQTQDQHDRVADLLADLSGYGLEQQYRRYKYNAVFAGVLRGLYRGGQQGIFFGYL